MKGARLDWSARREKKKCRQIAIPGGVRVVAVEAEGMGTGKPCASGSREKMATVAVIDGIIAGGSGVIHNNPTFHIAGSIRDCLDPSKAPSRQWPR